MPKKTRKKKFKTTGDKDTVFSVLDDLVANFLLYDREEDEDLPKGDIEKLIENESLTVDDLVERFRDQMEEHLEDLLHTMERDDEDDEGTDLDDLDEDEEEDE